MIKNKNIYFVAYDIASDKNADYTVETTFVNAKGIITLKKIKESKVK